MMGEGCLALVGVGQVMRNTNEQDVGAKGNRGKCGEKKKEHKTEDKDEKREKEKQKKGKGCRGVM